MGDFASYEFKTILEKIRNSENLSEGEQEQLNEFQTAFDSMTTAERKDLFSAVYISLKHNTTKDRILKEM